MVLGALLVSLLWSASLIYFAYLYLPVGVDSPVLVNIPAGSSVLAIGSKLQENGIIKSAKAFAIYVQILGKEGQLQAGTYELSPAWPLHKVAESILSGDVVDNSFRITIPEGLTLSAIGKLFEQRGVFSEQEFLSTAQSINLPYSYLQQTPAGVQHRLEGFLFPDTYKFPLGVKPEQVIRTMAARFHALMMPLFEASPQGQRFTLEQIVTMASIVEKEAVLSEERSIIAGVFYNRLASSMRLESCATIQYLLGTPRPLLYADLEIVSPYNTYRNDGLPPGPIANPGLASLKAALAPAETPYFFFVANSDGSHIFSVTYQQHLVAIRKAR